MTVRTGRQWSLRGGLDKIRSIADQERPGLEPEIFVNLEILEPNCFILERQRLAILRLTSQRYLVTVNMSSFFTAPASHKKRKRAEGSSGNQSKKRNISTYKQRPTNGTRPSTQQERDESISGSESGSSIEESDVDAEISSSDDENETGAERRFRLAERYLESIKEQNDPTGFDAAEIDRDLIAERLKEDVAESKGKIYRHIASELSFATAEHTTFQADQFAVTAVAAAPPYAYTVAKDLSVCKWEIIDPESFSQTHPSNITPRRKPRLIRTFKSFRPQSKPQKQLNHTAPILCVAVSQSGKFLATGGQDKKIVIWDATTLKPLKAFTQHRDFVYALSFRRNTHTLYSASADRTIKIWNVDEMTYVETLFGHEDKIVDLVGLADEKCISVGARDRTARLWKIIEESQLVFRGGGSGSKAPDGEVYVEGSIDRVAMVDEETFVTGSDNGNICLWSALRKKPIFAIPLAHGADLAPGNDVNDRTRNYERGRPQARWITALTAVPYSDLILSGSWDGYIRAWKISEDRRRLESAGILGFAKPSKSLTNGDTITTNGHHETESIIGMERLIRGVVNGIAVFDRGERGKDGICVVAAASKEHRLGKWKPITQGRCENVVFEVKSV
jgi:ribosomal RNA-processing protein 9